MTKHYLTEALEGKIIKNKYNIIFILTEVSPCERSVMSFNVRAYDIKNKKTYFHILRWEELSKLAENINPEFEFLE